MVDFETNREISKQSRLWFVDTTDVAKGFHSVLHNSMYTIVVVRKESLSIRYKH